MYIYIYICIYIYMCMYIYICICIQYISLYCDILTFPWFIVKITIYRSCYTQKISRRSRRTSRSWCALCGARLRHRTAGTLAFLRLRGSKAGIVQPRLWKYVKFAKVTDAAEMVKLFFSLYIVANCRSIFFIVFQQQESSFDLLWVLDPTDHRLL